MNNNQFVERVIKLCSEKNMEYIDAVVKICQEDNIEIETAAYWIKKDPTIKAIIESEAENINALKKTARLPI
jgi:hypothetical protein